MRNGDWIATFTGTKWYVMDPHPDDVRIEDIAHALSLVCRFAGHTREFYSVAQHSLLVAKIVAEKFPLSVRLQLIALLHDASEAYLGDVTRPLKPWIGYYKELEFNTQATIFTALGIRWGSASEAHHMIVKEADNIALMTERRDLITHCGIEWTPRAEPHPDKISPMPPVDAERSFLEAFTRLAQLYKESK